MSAIEALATTGIGSLPHDNVEDALSLSFRADVPYLPQLPKRDVNEYMLAYALDGMPGILVDEEGMITIDMATWRKGFLKYSERLALALEDQQPELLLPSNQSCSALRPFLDKLVEEKAPLAKVQMTGPLTLQWSLRTTEGQFPPPPVSAQVSRTVMAKSIALCRAVQSLSLIHI